MTEDGTARCDFCAFGCVLAPGQDGRCGVRGHREGGLVNLREHRVAALALDPMEKKPLYHVFPGGQVLSVALFGCNYRCPFCQNATLSQGEAMPAPQAGRRCSPADFAAQVLATPDRCAAYTYSEPTVWQDWMLEAASLIKAGGGWNVMVSNGSFSAAARARFRGLLDAYNLDLKGDEAFYRTQCRAPRGPVMANLEALAASPVILEVTTLVIEGMHEAAGLRQLGRELAGAGVRVWHLGAFHPAWRMQDRPPTRRAWLDPLVQMWREEVGIDHVYGAGCQDTMCPACGALLVHREGPGIPVATAVTLEQGPEGPRCPRCGRAQYVLLG